MNNVDRLTKTCSKTSLVSNQKGSRIYLKNTLYGRLWSVFHWLHGTQTSSLKNAIKHSHLQLNQLLVNQHEIASSIEAEGAFGNFWKNRSISAMRNQVDEHLKILSKMQWTTSETNRLSAFLSWAGVDKEFPDISTAYTRMTKASKKIATAENLHKEWVALGGASIAPLETLYRELLSEYPDNDEQLTHKRNILEEPLGQTRDINQYKCPPELLYGPIVKIAHRIFKHQKEKIRELQDFFSKLAKECSKEKRRFAEKNALKIVAIAKSFNGQANPLEDIPSMMKPIITNKGYLDHIGLDISNASKETSCCRVGGGYKSVWVSGNGLSSEGGRIAKRRVPYKHRRTYYRFTKFPDGYEKISTFYTLSKTA